MAQFHPLRVTAVDNTTHDAVVVTLASESGDFDFVQGQYLTFRRDFNGQEIRRSYSICAGRNDGALRVGIKRVAGGAFSTWANKDLRVGDVLEAMTPAGSFYAQAAATAAHYLAFAAGSGITPILSILRTGLEADETARFTLVYANRNPVTIMFREELEDLKNRNIARLNVVHVLSDESQETDLFRGRIDGEKCAAMFSKLIDVASVDMAFICGPEPMMMEISDALMAHGLPKEKIRYELFASAQPGRLPKPVSDTSEMKAGIAGRVTLGGDTRNLMIPQGSSLLEAAIAHNVDAPFACKAGVCSTCKCKVLEGDVEMVANHALEDYEVEAGYVLSCQAYPVSADRIVWDYDHAGH